jgi:hypothetical protein
MNAFDEKINAAIVALENGEKALLAMVAEMRRIAELPDRESMRSALLALLENAP